MNRLIHLTDDIHRCYHQCYRQHHLLHQDIPVVQTEFRLSHYHLHFLYLMVVGVMHLLQFLPHLHLLQGILVNQREFHLNHLIHHYLAYYHHLHNHLLHIHRKVLYLHHHQMIHVD